MKRISAIFLLLLACIIAQPSIAGGVSDLQRNEHFPARYNEITTTHQQLQEERTIRFNSMLIGGALIAVLLTLFLLRANQQQKKMQVAANAIQELEARNRQLEKHCVASKALQLTQEYERNRVAGELRDHVGELLAGSKLTLDQPANLSQPGVRKTIRQLDEALLELQSRTVNMLFGPLLECGLKEALQDYCSLLSKPGLQTIHLQYHGYPVPSEERDLLIFRIVQELVTNALHHGKANEVIVQFIANDYAITVTVEDNGKGFDPRVPVSGAGLQNVRYRAELLDAKLEIASGKEEGTVVSLEIGV